VRRSSLAEQARRLRTAVVGMSLSETCGVRDHAALLAAELERDGGASSSMHWLTRSEGSLRAEGSEIRAWTRRLAAELRRERPDAVLLHYSVFAYSYRGLPLFVHPTLAAIRGAGVPIVTFAHEFAYPWVRGGWHGKVWAVSQRALLLDVVRASTAVIVTTDARVRWLASRRWLARRPVTVAPVFSTLPPPAAAPPPRRPRQVVGLFGYASEVTPVSLVLDALRLLRDRGVEAQLALLGAPGRASAPAERWLAAAAARDLADTLSFSGVLGAQELSDALAACDVLLFADSSGPSSRKTTLAGSLASGRPVLAIDGPLRWSELVESDAARVVAPWPDELAEALGALLGDEAARDALGARGREFAERRMGVRRSAHTVAAALSETVCSRAS
jgi:glycosyltransferase involved in cell wall biosynthesis